MSFTAYILLHKDIPQFPPYKFPTEYRKQPKKFTKGAWEPRPYTWKSGFYDRIIRNDAELYKIRQYILDNPKNWDIVKK
jgi:REP element-mobilizing transposase RayT